MLLWYCAYKKVGILVHSWQGLSSIDIINIECILESVHLQRNIFTLHNNCTILELL